MKFKPNASTDNYGICFGFDALNHATAHGLFWYYTGSGANLTVGYDNAGSYGSLTDGVFTVTLTTGEWHTLEVYLYNSLGSKVNVFDVYCDGKFYWRGTTAAYATAMGGYYGVLLDNIATRLHPDIEFSEIAPIETPVISYEGFPGFIDHFDGNALDTNVWTKVGASATYSVASSMISILNAGGSYGEMYTKRTWLYGRLSMFVKDDYDRSGVFRNAVGFWDSGGSYYVRYNDGNFETYDGTVTQTAVAIPARTWNLIEIQWDPNVCRLYVNGQLVASHTTHIPANVWLPVHVFSGDTVVGISFDWIGVVGAHGLKNIDHLSLGTAASVSSRYFSAGTEVGNQYSVQMLSPGRIIGCQFRGSTTGETTAIKNVAPVYFVEGDEISCYINYVGMSDTVLEVHKNGSVQSVFSTTYSFSDKRNENWNGTILVEYL